MQGAAKSRHENRRSARTAAKRSNAHRAGSSAAIDRRVPSVNGVREKVQFAERTRPGTEGKVAAPALPEGVDVHAEAVAGTLADGNVPNLSAGKITSGVLKMDTLKGITSNGESDDAKVYSRRDMQDMLEGYDGNQDGRPKFAGKSNKGHDHDAAYAGKSHKHGFGDVDGNMSGQRLTDSSIKPRQISMKDLRDNLDQYYQKK